MNRTPRPVSVQMRAVFSQQTERRSDMKSKYSLVLLGALPLFGGSGTWGADDLKAIRSAPEPTVVSLLQNANNAVQLGAQIDGQFSYPFTFASDPSPTN